MICAVMKDDQNSKDGEDVENDDEDEEATMMMSTQSDCYDEG